MVRILVSLLFISYSVIASSTSLLDRDVQELWDGSTHVLDGRINEINAKCSEAGCIHLIRVEVFDAIKGGASNGDIIMACGETPVRLWSRYVIFANASDKSMLEKDECELNFQADGIFQRFGGDVFRYMSPGSFDRIRDSEGVIYIGGWREVKDFDYLMNKSKDR